MLRMKLSSHFWTRSESKDKGGTTFSNKSKMISGGGGSSAFDHSTRAPVPPSSSKEYASEQHRELKAENEGQDEKASPTTARTKRLVVAAKPPEGGRRTNPISTNPDRSSREKSPSHRATLRGGQLRTPRINSGPRLMDSRSRSRDHLTPRSQSRTPERSQSADPHQRLPRSNALEDDANSGTESKVGPAQSGSGGNSHRGRSATPKRGVVTKVSGAVRTADDDSATAAASRVKRPGGRPRPRALGGSGDAPLTAQSGANGQATVSPGGGELGWEATRGPSGRGGARERSPAGMRAALLERFGTSVRAGSSSSSTRTRACTRLLAPNDA